MSMLTWSCKISRCHLV